MCLTLFSASVHNQFSSTFLRLKHSKHDQTELHVPTLYWLTVSCKRRYEGHAFNTLSVALLCWHALAIWIVSNNDCHRLYLREE